MSTGLERVFGRWAAQTAQLGGPDIDTIHVRIDPNGSYGQHWALTDAQEQRLIDVLLADINALKEESH